MRKTIIFFLLVVAFGISNCTSNSNKGAGTVVSQSSQKNNAEIVFKEYEHDFGKVTEGEKVAYVFTFENKGSADLVLTSVTTSCGCTVPKYETKPVAPGGEGNLEVIFDTSGRSATQTKVITVKSNASKPVVLLKITAEVITNHN
jgi:hypothetical protein